MKSRCFVEQQGNAGESGVKISNGILDPGKENEDLGGEKDLAERRFGCQDKGKGVVREMSCNTVNTVNTGQSGTEEPGPTKRLKVLSNAEISKQLTGGPPISTAERETSAIMNQKMSEMAASGSILIDPTRPDTLLRAEVEALRAICEEPLRVFRQATCLDSPGWKPFSHENPGKMYHLLAIGKLVWRVTWTGFPGEEFGYERVESHLLDKSGYMWQMERGRWDRLLAPDETGLRNRIEIGEVLEERGIGGDVVMEG